MGVVTYEQEVASSISAAKLFKAFVIDGDTLIPKVVSQAMSIEIVQGDGGVGSIKKITFGEGSYVKHMIEAIDNENFTYSYSVVEGDALMDKLEKISYVTKFVAGPDGGSVMKSTSTYYTKGDVEIKEEDIKAGKEKAMGLFEAVEVYLLANPDA